ncbi:helix-turn-helix domain-containing protein [Rhizobium sp. RU36D]|uniref:helix-turn-helix domain-containing protein n=1 Tax=Rhizobium sp. RU36D TaxID=1907415 RepID=UPI0009D7BA1F|nr:helix-turn-helix domain-containing protein [Rhizobium sp. RU36D]SMC96898.1 dnaA protein helix-turn-helix [Rhizobium sp. RU36D]
MSSPIAAALAPPLAPPVYPPEPDATTPINPLHLSHCAAIWQMTEEMLALTAGDRAARRDRRRLACHARQIAMYVCHVVLRLSLSEIGRAFGRDRTTVGHACHVVEDRRDDPAFEAFVSALERVARRLVEPQAGVFHG